MVDRNRHIIVLGAGPGGLACAHKLNEYGYKITVIEREPHVGGLCKTTEQDGYRFDVGGHRWFTKNQDLHKWFLRLMEGRLVEVERISRILFNGKYFDYPISLKNVLSSAGLWTCFLCGVDYLLEAARNFVKPRKINSMEDAFVAQFGRRLFNMFFRRYSEKVWGRPCSELSADWVSQRSKGLSIWKAVANAVLKPKDKMATLIETFVYPKWGYQEVCNKMQEDLEAAGQVVILDAMVRTVDHSHDDKVVVRYQQNGKDCSIDADYCVSTVPLTGLLAYGLDPKPPQEIIDAALSLEFRSVITVNVMIDKPQMTKDTWLYCHDEGIGFARLHEPRNWSPWMAPEGKTSVVLEYFCTQGDEWWQMSDEELVELGTKDLLRLGFITREQVLGGYPIRAANAYPVYSMGYLDKLTRMRKHIEGLTRVAIVGRGGTFRYNNSDHSIEMGLLTAQMINGEVDESAVLDVNSSLEYGERNLISANAEDNAESPSEKAKV
jgi:protoporphyrinogen oxidase